MKQSKLQRAQKERKQGFPLCLVHLPQAPFCFEYSCKTSFCRPQTKAETSVNIGGFPPSARTPCHPFACGKPRQARPCIIKELPVRRAKVIFAFPCQPVPPASASAQRRMRAVCADCRPLQALPHKRTVPLSCHQRIQGCIVNVAQPPVIHRIEVTGICATVRLNHQVASATPSACAGSRGYAHGQMYIIIKLTDTRILTMLPVIEPAVKERA